MAMIFSLQVFRAQAIGKGGEVETGFFGGSSEEDMSKMLHVHLDFRAQDWKSLAFWARNEPGKA